MEIVRQLLVVVVVVVVVVRERPFSTVRLGEGWEQLDNCCRVCNDKGAVFFLLGTDGI